MDNTREEKVKEYRDSKFGIFMHWGPIAGRSNETWNAVDFQPSALSGYIEKFNKETEALNVDEWMSFFKEIGAKYFSFVPRHTENLFYNLYESKVFNFCSKRDYMKEVSDACGKYDINLIIYQPLGGFGYHKWVKEGSPNYETEAQKRYQQILEGILEAVVLYQPYAIWLDGWPRYKLDMKSINKNPFDTIHFDEIAVKAREIKSNLLIGNKEMVKPYIDYVCTEEFFNDHFGNPISGELIPTEITETLPSSKHWFSSYEQDIYTLSEDELNLQKRLFVKRFFSVIGRGMNYLLNVGPLPNGDIPHIDKEILSYLGKWINRFSEAIYSTRYYDSDSYEWGYAVKKGDIYFLYVVDLSDIQEAITCHSVKRKEDYCGEVPKCFKTGCSNDTVELNLPKKPLCITLQNESENLKFSYQAGKLSIFMNKSKYDDEVLILKVE